MGKKKKVIWGVKNCDLGDTDLGKTKGFLGKRKNQGLIKARTTRLNSDTEANVCPEGVAVMRCFRVRVPQASQVLSRYPGCFVRKGLGHRSDFIGVEMSVNPVLSGFWVLSEGLSEQHRLPFDFPSTLHI